MELFNAPSLTFRRKILVFFGAKIDINNTQSGQLVGFIKVKAFKLKEDIRIYTDKTQTTELMSIKARSIIDLGATYDVIDSTTQTPLMIVKREAFSSVFVRDQWNVFDTNGQPYAHVEETGSIALYRRYFDFIPIIGDIFEIFTLFQKQHYTITYIAGGASARAGNITRQKNPFVVKYITDVQDTEVRLDGRIIAGIGAMLSIIEASKN